MSYYRTDIKTQDNTGREQKKNCVVLFQEIEYYSIEIEGFRKDQRSQVSDKIFKKLQESHNTFVSKFFV